MSAESINQLFSSPIFVLMAIFTLAGLTFSVIFILLARRWHKTAKENTLVLIAGLTGSGRFMLAPNVGAEVSVPNPHNSTIRTWPVNELATIDMPYPGVDFVPEFMQTKIRMAIVNEGDWEPVLNRSPHRENIASPDIVLILESIRDNPSTPGDTREKLTARLSRIATGPTREMIASPAVLGNLLHEKITEVVLAINKEIIDTLESLVRRLSETSVRPMVFYISIGVLAVLSIVNMVVSFQSLSAKDDLNLIKNALGIQQPTPEPKSSGGFGGILGGK